MSIIHQQAQPAGTRRRNTRGSSQRRKPRKKRSGLLTFLSDWPSWAVWIGGILIACAYAYLFYYFFVGPFSFRWKAIYGDPPYPEGYNIRGIDISHYQTSIDWDVLRNASINNDPVRFVFIKATEGVQLMDDNFNDNFYQARENDFVRGAYHFYVPGVDVKQQAQFYLHQVHLEPGDLPPVLDVEKTGHLTPAQVKKDVLTWLQIVEKHYGVKPILYTGYKFKMDYLNDSIFNQYPYWIAHYYVNELSYQGDWVFWQHTDCGKVPGIKGFVDCNIFNGNLQQLMQFCIKEEE